MRACPRCQYHPASTTIQFALGKLEVETSMAEEYSGPLLALPLCSNCADIFYDGDREAERVRSIVVWLLFVVFGAAAMIYAHTTQPLFVDAYKNMWAAFMRSGWIAKLIWPMLGVLMISMLWMVILIVPMIAALVFAHVLIAPWWKRLWKSRKRSFAKLHSRYEVLAKAEKTHVFWVDRSGVLKRGEGEGSTVALKVRSP